MTVTRHLYLLFTLLLFTGLSINAHAGPVCGDDVIEGDETCEPPNSSCNSSGNNVGGDELCRADVCTCCGDGIVDGDYNEACDDGNTNPNDECNTEGAGGFGACTLTFCGDGFLQTPNGNGVNEQCEPAGTSTCNDNCQITTTTTTSTTTSTTSTSTTTSTTPATTTSTTTVPETTTSTTTVPETTTTTVPVVTTTTAPATTTTTVPETTTTTTTTPVVTTTTAPATTTTTVPATTTTTTEVTTTTTVPPGGGNVVIDGCDTGVEDTGGIQDGINACAFDARNHGQFVRCVAIFTRSEGMSQTDRRPVMKCAAQSSIGSPGAVPSSSGGAGNDSAKSEQGNNAVVTSVSNVMIEGRDTGVADEGGMQATIDQCAADASSHRKFVKCVRKYANGLKRQGIISKQERKAIKLMAKRSGIGR